jgi:hypothetical protein
VGMTFFKNFTRFESASKRRVDPEDLPNDE